MPGRNDWDFFAELEQQASSLDTSIETLKSHIDGAVDQLGHAISAAPLCGKGTCSALPVLRKVAMALRQFGQIKMDIGVRQDSAETDRLLNAAIARTKDSISACVVCHGAYCPISKKVYEANNHLMQYRALVRVANRKAFKHACFGLIGFVGVAGIIAATMA